MDDHNAARIDTAPRPREDFDGNVIKMKSPAENRLRAGPKRARWKMLLAVICIVLPSSTVGAYEFGFAADQYVSQFAFVVREQTPMMMEPNSVMPSLAGGNPLLEMIEDSEVVKRYIESPQILMDLQDKFSLPAVYGMPHGDWWSRMDTSGSRETKLSYWDDMVTPYFDISSGIITVQVRAYTAHDAAMVAADVLAASEALVNRMSATARDNALAFSEKDAAAARAKLLQDEVALADYRNHHKVLFPALTAQSTSTVAVTLGNALATDQASLATLTAQGQTAQSPQVQTLQARVAATRAEIAKLDDALASPNDGDRDPGTLASVLSGYDNLSIAETLDQQLYASALLALQNAQAQAAQKQIYLEAFQNPAAPTSSTAPKRLIITLSTFAAGLIGWMILVLFIQAMVDRAD
jgi:capsular polysaccharide transport system permease protein